MPGVSTTTVGLRTAWRRDVLQHLQQLFGIIFDRQDRQAVEHLRKSALHHLAVFQHVRHARGTAQVVFEHVDLAVAIAHQVGARDVAPDTPRRIQPGARLEKALARLDQPVGNDAVANDFLLVVDVVDEQVQRRMRCLSPLR